MSESLPVYDIFDCMKRKQPFFVNSHNVIIISKHMTKLVNKCEKYQDTLKTHINDMYTCYEGSDMLEETGRFKDLTHRWDQNRSIIDNYRGKMTIIDKCILNESHLGGDQHGNIFEVKNVF